jgi:hypothetical protein
MSTFGELETEILAIVPRTNQTTMIRNKINQIIRFISSSGYFWRDILESTIGSSEGVVATDKIQAIPITTAIRKMVYVQYTNDDTRITCVSLNGIKKRETCGSLLDIAYLSGNALHIRHSILTPDFNIGYYTNPVNFAIDGSEDDDTNWITELAPGLVVDMTAAYLLNLVGDNEDSKRISDLAALMRSTYIRDFMDSVDT